MSVFRFLICYHIFFTIYCETNLGTFSYYHLMVVNGSKIVPKSSKRFVCACCDYSTSRKSQYSRHLLTAKHLNRVNDSKMIVKKFQEVPKKKSFVCGCGKEYRYDSGFYRHKRSCTYTGDIIDEPMEPVKEDSDKVEFCK